jgi:hypothetical protein
MILTTMVAEHEVGAEDGMGAEDTTPERTPAAVL